MIEDYNYQKLYDSLAADDQLVRRSIDTVSSNKSRLVCLSMFMMVNMERRVLDTTQGHSSIWCIPKSRRDTLVAIDSKLSAQHTYEAKGRNYNRCINNLEKDKIIHSFGVRDMTAYCFEPFVLSWSHCSESESILFPASILRLIDSKDTLFAIFMTQSYGRNITYDMLIERFAKFISEKVELLYPSVRGKVAKLQDSNYEDYVRCVRNNLIDLDPLDGRQYVKFKLESLPDNVYASGVSVGDSGFSELIPRDSRISAASVVSGRSMETPVPSVGRWVSKMSGADMVPNVELNITKDPIHLLQLLERDIRRKLGIPSDRRLFTDYANEVGEAKKIWIMLDEFGLRNYDNIRRWVSWFAVNYDKNKPAPCGLEALRLSWEAFIDEPFEFVEDNEPQGDIVMHLNEMFLSFNRQHATLEGCLTYGYFVTYAYMKVNYGKEIASRCMSLVAGEMQGMMPKLIDIVRRRVTEMTRSSARYSMRYGTLNEDIPNFMSRISSLMQDCGVDPNGDDFRKFKKNQTNSEKAFWNYVGSHF